MKKYLQSFLKTLITSAVCLVFCFFNSTLYGQNFLPGFTCSFANPDGASVIACGSVVTSTVHYPESITHVALTAPNSFMVNDVSVWGGDYQLRADRRRLGAAYI